MASLTSEKRAILKRSVESIKLDTGLSYPENSLIEICNALEVEVVSAKLPDLNGKKVKGYIKWFNESEINKKYKARIYLNQDQRKTTRNFTLAHEIGHFIHHKGKDNFRVDLEDYSNNTDPLNHETEANYFAGALLMPKDKLILAIENSKTIADVARVFGVSIPAIESRLKWLNIKLLS